MAQIRHALHHTIEEHAGFAAHHLRASRVAAVILRMQERVGGLGVLDGAPKIAGRALLDELRDAIEGGSRRPFPASVTTDEIERRKIQRFFPLFF